MEQIEEYLSNPKNENDLEPYKIFRNHLDSYKQKLKDPLAELPELNKKCNSIGEDVGSNETEEESNDPVYEKEYKENYTKSH